MACKCMNAASEVAFECVNAASEAAHVVRELVGERRVSCAACGTVPR